MFKPNRPLVFHKTPRINRITVQLTITGREQNKVSRELFLCETFGVADILNFAAVTALKKLYQIYAMLKACALKEITAEF